MVCARAREAVTTAGTVVGDPGESFVVVSSGQFDLAPEMGTPPAATGRSVPPDWDTVTRPVPSGRLALQVSVRHAEALLRVPDDLTRRLQLAVRLATWSTWPGPFGRQGQSPPQGPLVFRTPSAAQRRWGPELTSRLATTGAAEVDLAWWAAGARFVAVELALWWLSAESPAVAFDWAIVEDARTRNARTPWPISERVSLGPESRLVSSCGLVHGGQPTVAAVTNSGEVPLVFTGEILYGPAAVELEPVDVPPQSSRVVVHVAEGDPVTGILLRGSAEHALDGASPHPVFATITYAGTTP